MAKVLVIHHDASVRAILESLARQSHHVECAKDLKSGIRQMVRSKPDVILVGHDASKKEGFRLLRYMKINVLSTPVVVVVSRGAGVLQPALVKLGAKAFVEYPLDHSRLEEALASALKAAEAARGGPPPISEEELQGNLSVLERQLNQRMKCFAGRNQVFIHSLLMGTRTTRPRIALRCPLRADYGLNQDVYYEFIREVCCGEPGQCAAAQQFRAARETA